MRPKDLARVISHADRDSAGCLVSRYSVGSHGYAQAWDGKTVVLAHRLVWVHANGPIPNGMTVDHTCKNRKCVEIAHLRLISNFENARRTRGRDWPLGFCAQGHPNSELRKRGKRTRCRICSNEANQRWRTSQKRDKK